MMQEHSALAIACRRNNPECVEKLLTVFPAEQLDYREIPSGPQKLIRSQRLDLRWDSNEHILNVFMVLFVNGTLQEEHVDKIIHPATRIVETKCWKKLQTDDASQPVLPIDKNHSKNNYPGFYRVSVEITRS